MTGGMANHGGGKKRKKGPKGGWAVLDTNAARPNADYQKFFNK